MLWSPTIRAAVLAGTPWLDVFCPGCGIANLAGIDDLDFPPNWGGRSSHICDHRFDDGRVVVRVDEHRNTGGSRKKVSQQPQPL